jgi:protein-tyrosine phosphatase
MENLAHLRERITAQWQRKRNTVTASDKSRPVRPMEFAPRSDYDLRNRALPILTAPALPHRNAVDGRGPIFAGTMIDLHCHILPGIDDGAPDLASALEMAAAFAGEGVTGVVCTPHILPGVYPNAGPAIRAAVARLQLELDEHGVALTLHPGADNHIVPDFVAGLHCGRLLPLADSRYVLVEPPHHVAPPRIEDLFFGILVAGYVPILTHPERLSWINSHYPVMERLSEHGVWMQVTAGSLAGRFGRNAQYWAERMLDEGRVQVLATDAHDTRRRPPELARGWELAAARVGEIEAGHLVVTRPLGVIGNAEPSSLPEPAGARERKGDAEDLPDRAGALLSEAGRRVGHGGDGGLAHRLRRYFA